ncbi:YaiI/YqxD family protein [Halalkalibacillus halophilus]|uniref:YaiI/YqxD family protein n=1 Tax=Halalkalibacillus halophilus TaxID=392827 RepID=UPI00041192B1|nr:YaiI/YqxD family protein [Halalkalibacillus halophilus]
MKIFIDADACPVTNVVIEEAFKRDILVTLVKSYAHFSPNDQQPGVETIYVDSASEAADYKLIALVKQGDMIITQDYGLASLGLNKGCHVLHHKGFVYTHDNIDQLLQSRYLSAMARKSGQRTKGPKAFTNQDQEKFRNKLIEVLEP